MPVTYLLVLDTKNLRLFRDNTGAFLYKKKEEQTAQEKDVPTKNMSSPLFLYIDRNGTVTEPQMVGLPQGEWNVLREKGNIPAFSNAIPIMLVFFNKID